MIPDLDPTTVTWEAFGFPDPTFTPAGYGFFALEWALRERGIFFQETDWSNRFAKFVETPSGSSFHRGFNIVMSADLYSDFDFALWNVSEHYLHPNRREAYLRGELTMEAAAWTIKELMTAAAGGDPSAVVGWVDTGTEDWTWSANYRMSRWRFMPEYYLPWLIQRYNALNLLRYAVPVYNSSAHLVSSEFITGSAGYGTYYSTPEALTAAAVNGSRSETDSSFDQPLLEYYYYSENRGYHSCHFLHLKRLFCKIPTGVTNWSGYLGADFWVPNGYIAPPNYAAPGYNRIASDGNGDFIMTDIFPFWTGTTLPIGENAKCTLAINGEPRVYFDLHPQFRFKEN